MTSAYRTLHQPGRRELHPARCRRPSWPSSAPRTSGRRQTDETLVVNSFGGEYQELFEKAVIQPFEKKFGVKVVHDTTGTSSQDYAKIRASQGRARASTSRRR